jgi:predicted RNA binding protein YcfA (HicA-like mRNA interferase family)
MGSIPGVPHQRAVRALEKAGFRIIREGKHIVMSDGRHRIVIPRNDPIARHTMAGIVRDAGLTEAEFRAFL